MHLKEYVHLIVSGGIWWK